MEEKKQHLETFIKEELEKEAEAVRKEDELLQDEETVPIEVKERIRRGLDAAIEEYEYSRRYPELSEEDRKALRMGREALEKEKAGREKTDGKTTRRKRGRRFYLALAAVLVFVLAVGVVSLGGAERAIRFMKNTVGEREVAQVDSSEDNLVIVKEDEAEAYQIMKEEFGVAPVRIVPVPNEKIWFDSMEFNRSAQLAELCYYYNNEKLIYFINASYEEASWAIDPDDQTANVYQLERKGCLIEIKEYAVEGAEKGKWSAKFQYKGLEYFLIGGIDQTELEDIINSLHFL